MKRSNNKDPRNWVGVVTPKPTGADVVYPKEKALIDICKVHKAAGHQMWVYCQMTGKRNVLPRLKMVLEREGLKVGIMETDDVEAEGAGGVDRRARPRVRRHDVLPEAGLDRARLLLEGAGWSQLQLHRLL